MQIVTQTQTLTNPPVKAQTNSLWPQLIYLYTNEPPITDESTASIIHLYIWSSHQINDPAGIVFPILSFFFLCLCDL